MKKITTLILAAALAALGSSAYAGETSTLLKRRLANSADITQGKWHRNFTKAKAWAVANGVPFVAVWSNGDSCPRCVKFENCLNNSVFKNYEVDSGIVFWFGYSGDSEYKIDSTAFHWARNNKLTSYPFVRVYWPAGKVDVATTGDSIEGYTNGASGSKLVVAYLQKKLKNWSPVDPDLPYTIAFDANAPEDFDGTGDYVTEADPVETTYSTAVKVTNPFKIPDYTFIGWSLAKGGAVKYSDGASVSKLTETENDTVTLYANWAKSKYTIVFDANYTPDELTADDDREMDSYDVAYNASAALPAVSFSRTDYAFTGWALTPTGSVAYKDQATVKNLDTDGEVTLYAKWTQTTFRQWYTGVKATITKVTSLKGRTISGSIPGMSWVKSTGKFTGTPKTAGEYRIAFKKSGATTLYRTFVIVKDTAELTSEDDIIDESTVYLDNSSSETLNMSAVSGALKNCKATGLPEGMTCSSAGVITGRPEVAGEYTVKVTGTSVNGQTVTNTYTFKVEQGDTFLLNGTAHFDELWAGKGDTTEVPLRLRIKRDDTFSVVKPSGEVTVDVYADGDYSLSNEDGEYGKYYYDADSAALVISPAEGVNVSEFKVVLTTDVEDGDDTKSVSWEFWLELFDGEE